MTREMRNKSGNVVRKTLRGGGAGWVRGEKVKTRSRYVNVNNRDDAGFGGTDREQRPAGRSRRGPRPSSATM